MRLMVSAASSLGVHAASGDHVDPRPERVGKHDVAAAIDMGRIVVGVDGSAELHQALAWALEEARLRGDELTVVHAYPPPKDRDQYASAYAYVPEDILRVIVDREDVRRAERHDRARQRAEALVADIIRDVAPDGAGVPLKSLVVEDDRPARALIRSARDADLLVVGSRGLGAVRGRLLGSVSQACVRHAPSAVLVVTPERAPAPAAA